MNTKHKLYAKYVLSFFTIILLGIFAHPDNVLADTIIVGSTIDVDTTWTSNNIYVIQDDSLTILQSITLTIEPGTIVKIHGDGPGGGIIGQAPDQKNLFIEGTLVADGTSANPIYFTSLRDDTIGGDTNGDGGATTPQAGNWGRIVFATTSSGSILDNVVIRYAGAVDDSPTGNVGPTYYGAIILEDSAPTISNSILANNARWGIYASDDNIVPGSTTPTITDNLFSVNGDFAISVDTNSFPTLAGNTLVNNMGNGMEIREGILLANTLWNQTSIVYAVNGNITINPGVTLTIEPGLIVKLDGDGPGGGIIGQAPDQKNFFVEGTLVADGTSANPIYFTSLRDDTIGGDTNGDGGATTPQAGNWGRIVFATTSSGSILDNVVIRYAGAVDDSPTGNVGPTYYGAIILEDSSLAISDATIAHNALHGVHLKGTASIDFDGCNNIFANNDYGLLNESDNYANAPNNWWGDENGPFHPTLNPQGQGNAASDDVGFTPWRTSPCGELGVSHLYLPIVLR